MKSWRNSPIAFENLGNPLTGNAFSSIHGLPMATDALEELLVCAPDAVSEATERLARDHSANIVFSGAAGAGKSHCAEVVVRRLAERHQWRVVRLPDCHALQGFAEFVGNIVERDGGDERDWDAPVPSAEASIEALQVRERQTGRPLVLLLEDLPAVLERTLRGADLRRFSNLLGQLQIAVVATARTTRLGRAARPLLAQLRDIPIRDLDPTEVGDLILRCAHVAGDEPDGHAVTDARTLAPLIGGNPRLLTTLYRLAAVPTPTGRNRDTQMQLLGALLAHMAPHFRAQLAALSPQQGLLLTRLALAPGPMPAARLGRQCDLPTSHTTAILDVLLQKQLVVRVPGPGKRNVYAVTDRLQRQYICLQVRAHAHVQVAELTRFFDMAQTRTRQRQALMDMRAEIAQVMKAQLAPDMGDIRASLQGLAELLRTRDDHPGNRVLSAFLDQPQSVQEVAKLRSTTDAGASSPNRASDPERAVAHVALAAHYIRECRCGDAGEELSRALGLAPNWRDLAVTRFLADLAADHAAPPAPAPDGKLAASVHAVAAFLARAPNSEVGLRAAIERGGAKLAPVWRAIGAMLPVSEAARERAMDYFRVVCEAGQTLDQPDVQFLGIACVYAAESQLWSDAASYAAARDECLPLAPACWPAWAWLAAMSGDLAAFVDIALRCEQAPDAPSWLLLALPLAARTVAEPEAAARAMAGLFRHRERSPAEHDLLLTGLLLVREDVSTDWLARVSGLLAEQTGRDSLPFQAFREFVSGGRNERFLRTLHPEIRAAVNCLRSSRSPAA